MRLIALVAALAICGAGARAGAAETPMVSEAKALYDQAMAHYAAREYRAAVRALEAAYGFDPRPEFLFAEAQATRLAGDCAAALGLYRRFLATNPPPQQVEATRIAVARCETPPAPPPIVVAPPAPPPPPRWYRDRAGRWLVGAGLIGAGAGAALLASAHARDDDARGATTFDDFSSRRHAAERRWGWGLGLTVAGAALVAAGAGRYLWVAAHPQGAAIHGEVHF